MYTSKRKAEYIQQLCNRAIPEKVPKEFLNDRDVFIACQQHHSHWCLSFSDSLQHDHTLALQGILTNPYLIRHLPESLQDDYAIGIALVTQKRYRSGHQTAAF